MRIKKVTVHFIAVLDNVYKSTVETPEQGTEYFQN